MNSNGNPFSGATERVNWHSDLWKKKERSREEGRAKEQCNRDSFPLPISVSARAYDVKLPLPEKPMENGAGRQDVRLQFSWEINSECPLALATPLCAFSMPLKNYFTLYLN